VKKRRKFILFFALGVTCFTVVYITHAQKQREVNFRQVARHPVGSKPGELAVRVASNKMVVAPKLLSPDAEGNFWVVDEVNGGIVRLNRSGQVITIVRPPHSIRPWPAVNSSGQMALHLRSNAGEEIVVYSPTGQKLGGFEVKGCPQCKHPYCQTIMGLDNGGRIWLRFLSSDRSVEEDPKQTVCVAAFNLQGNIVQHVEGSWAVDVKGRLRRRTKSIGGSYLLFDPETMKTSEIPVPRGWDGIFIGMDPDRDLIWWDGWRLDNIEVTALIAFDKQGIVATLPRPPNKTLWGDTSGEEILLTEVAMGTDGRLYMSQTGKGGFYIFEADMAFLER